MTDSEKFSTDSNESRIIRITSLALGIVYIVGLPESVKILWTYLTSGYAELDSTLILMLASILVLPVLIFLFWKRKKAGWIGIHIYLFYSLIVTGLTLYSTIGMDSGDSILNMNTDGLLSSEIKAAIHLVIFGGSLYSICSGKIRVLYQVTRQTMINLFAAMLGIIALIFFCFT